MVRAVSPRRSGWPPLSWFLLLAASVLFGMVISSTRLTQPASNLTYDALSKFIAPQFDERLLIVAIDDESVNRIGRWPWNRDVHAQALKQLSQAGAKHIIYDVLFTEPSDAAADRQLADATAQARAQGTSFPVAFEVPGRDGHDVSVKLPIPELVAAQARVGAAAATVDDDGIFRRIPLTSRADGQSFTHIVPLAMGIDPNRLVHTPLISFARRGTAATVPFSAVLKGELPAETLKERIILVGNTAAGLGDRFATPVSRDSALTPGVEVLANIANNLLKDRLITDTGLPGTWGMLLLSLTVLALCFLRLDPRITIFVAVALGVVLIGASLLALRLGWWIDPAPAMITLMLLFPAWGWQRLAVANRQIGQQLMVLRDEVGILDQPAADAASPDRVSRQLTALEAGIERSIDSRRFIRSSFDSLPDPAIVVRDDGEIALANSEAQRAFMHYCGVAVPPMATDALAIFLPHITGDRGLLFDKFRARTGDPVEISLVDDRHYQMNIGTFRNSRSQEFIIIRMSDLTALRRAERQRRDAVEFLSHDIRSPQSSIIGLVDGHPDEISEPVGDRVKALARRTLQLAQSFVDISRVQAGSYIVSEIDLRDIVQEALDSLWQDSRAKNIKTRVTEQGEGEPVVRADQLLLLRAVSNMINNAIKYAPEATELHISIRRRLLRDGRDGWACLIDDQGPGIAREDRGRVFERFQSGSRASGGVGLGLALVAAVATEFGGYAACASKLGVGSRFILWLPTVPQLLANRPATD